MQRLGIRRGVAAAQRLGLDLAQAEVLRRDLEVCTAPSSSAATLVGPEVVISSRPSEPCTTQTRSEPRFFSTCASGSIHCLENTPTICRLTPAGFDSGPSRLKMVRVPSSTRVGADVLHRRDDAPART